MAAKLAARDGIATLLLSLYHYSSIQRMTTAIIVILYKRPCNLCLPFCYLRCLTGNRRGSVAAAWRRRNSVK